MQKQNEELKQLLDQYLGSKVIEAPVSPSVPVVRACRAVPTRPPLDNPMPVAWMGPTSPFDSMASCSLALQCAAKRRPGACASHPSLAAAQELQVPPTHVIRVVSGVEDTMRG